jgi:diguanylate cyclase (GGDEF)-like protein/PAS domain S-box-containing protein
MGNLSPNVIDAALQRCSAEAIHKPGSIQPHGLLIAADDVKVVRYVSANIDSFLPLTGDAVLGRGLEDLFGKDFAESLQPLPLNSEGGATLKAISLSYPAGAARITLPGYAHYHDRMFIIELEHEENRDRREFFEHTFVPIRDRMWVLEGETDLVRYLAAMAEQIGQLTGFDRTMIYRFDSKWDGEVIAEYRLFNTVESYLGHHFPAADIPPQARDLYLRNRARQIGDVTALQISLLSAPGTSSQLLDLSYSALRSFSPVHLEYLENMGVGASLSISLVINGSLWGLIACHHRQKLVVAPQVRELVEFIGRSASVRIGEIEESSKAAVKARAQQALDAISASIADDHDLDVTFGHQSQSLLEIAGAGGAVICIDHRKYHIGKTPDIAALHNFSDWVRKIGPSDYYFTDALPEECSAIRASSSVASGVLVVPLEQEMANFVMWFRPEVVESIRWAGNPEKIVERAADGLRISPRKSFSAWVQSYLGHSADWKRTDLDILQTLSMALIARVKERRLKTGLQALEMFADAKTYIAELDKNLRYLRVSPNCREILGYNTGEMEGHFLSDFLFAEDVERFRREVQDSGGKERSGCIFRHASKDGHFIWIEGKIESGPEDSGGHLTLMARDVTERQHYNEAVEDLHHRYHRIQGTKREGVVVLNGSGTVIRSNDAANALLGRTPQQMDGLNFCQTVCRMERCAFGMHPHPVESQTAIAQMRGELIHEHGRPIPVTMWAVVLVPEKPGDPTHALIFSPREEDEQTDSDAVTGVMITDRNGRIQAISDGFTQITGYAISEAVGRTPALLRSNVHSPEFYRNFWRILATEGVWRGEIWNRRKNGEVYPQIGSIVAISAADGQVAHYVSIFSDISKAGHADEKSHLLPEHDVLTGLPNRLLFERKLTRELDAAAQKALAVAVIDLNNFSAINDALGHISGDRLLYQVAARISQALRGNDLLARWGGDKFALMLPGVRDGDDASMGLRRVVDSIAAPFSIMGKQVIVTANIGVSLSPRDGNTADRLMQTADAAMNQAKTSGKGGIGVFDEALSANSKNRFEIANDLRRAIMDHEFFLVYQPQVHAQNAATVGLEALVRWRHPRGGVVAPADFILIAEDNGMMEELGAEIFTMACAQIKKWREAGEFNIPVGINVSPRQMTTKFPGFVRDTIEEYGIPAELIEIEITESALVPTPEIREIMAAFKNLGVKLAIDDFGTGYSSLSHLKLFPFDRLKVDKSFVDGLPSNADDVAIGQAIIALGLALKVNVLAEGVETADQAEFLKNEGVHVIQGYFYSRPLASEDVPAFIDRGDL